MADLFSGELSKVPDRSRLPCACGIQERIESTEPLLSNVGVPLVSEAVVRDSLDAAGVVDAGLAVAKVFPMAGKSQIFDAVVGPYSVDVVDVEAVRYLAVHVNPCKTMGVMNAPMDGHLDVAVDLVQAPTLLSNHVTTPVSD